MGIRGSGIFAITFQFPSHYFQFPVTVEFVLAKL